MRGLLLLGALKKFLVLLVKRTSIALSRFLVRRSYLVFLAIERRARNLVVMPVQLLNIVVSALGWLLWEACRR